MPALQHVYVTAHGVYTAANWVGEVAQVGVRCVLSRSVTVPGRGSIWTLPTDNGDVEAAFETVAGPNGTLTQQWTARVGQTGSPVNADSAVQIDLAEDMRTFLASTSPRVSSHFRWTHVKIAPVLASGKYGAASSIYTFSAPVVGGSASGMLPPEVAIAVSWKAPVLGRRGRGRVYLPAIAVDTLAADGVINPTPRANLAASGAQLVANLEAFPGIDTLNGTFVIMSAGSQSAVIPTQCRVGTHADSQRRRQDDIAETYTVVDL